MRNEKEGEEEGGWWRRRDNVKGCSFRCPVHWELRRELEGETSHCQYNPSIPPDTAALCYVPSFTQL